MGTTNIPVNVLQAMMYIIAVDDLQLSQGTGGSGTYRWQDWHWTLAESAYWTSQRAIVEPLLEPYNNKKNDHQRGTRAGETGHQINSRIFKL